ncbi:MAG: AI-2E family transporter [Roseovarius sp.]
MPDDGLTKAVPVPMPRPASGWFATLERGAFQTAFLGVIAGLMLLAAMQAASLIVIPIVLALLCAIALAPSVRWLERTGAPASLCAALVVGGLLVGTAMTVYAFAPSAEAINARAPEILRAVELRTRQIISGLAFPAEDGSGSGALPKPEVSLVTNPDNPPETETDAEPDEDGDTVDKMVAGGRNLLADWAIGAPRLAAGALFWAMLTFFLLRDRVLLARFGLGMVPRPSTRRAVGRAMRDVRTNVARYLLVITLVNIVLGIFVAAAFYLIGMANAPLWGVAAALANFMPIIGFAILAVVTLAVGIVSFDNPVIAVAPFAVIVVLNAIEAQVVTPMIIGSRIKIAPIAVFLAIAFGAWLWGAAGALVATPALIVGVAFVRRLNATGLRSQPARQPDSGQKRDQRQ